MNDEAATPPAPDLAQQIADLKVQLATWRAATSAAAQAPVRNVFFVKYQGEGKYDPCEPPDVNLIERFNDGTPAVDPTDDKQIVLAFAMADGRTLIQRATGHVTVPTEAGAGDKPGDVS